MKNSTLGSRLGLWLIALTTALLLMGCGSIGTATEGEIIVYTTMDMLEADAYLAVFNAQYPNIKVQLLSDSTSVISQRVLAEKENPIADVLWAESVTSLLVAEWNDLLLPYAPKELERIELQFRSPTAPPYWVGSHLSINVFCINTAYEEKWNLDPPHSWQDLLDPVYKGQILMPNPNTSQTGFLTLASFLQNYRETTGWQYIDQLHVNVAQYTAPGVEPCELVAKGEYAIGISLAQEAQALKKEGKAIELIFPTEGVAVQINGNALINKVSIKPAAKTFLDWAISDVAMNEYTRYHHIKTIDSNQTVPEGLPTQPTEQLRGEHFAWVAANRLRILKEWQQRFD